MSDILFLSTDVN